jgi:hypothetical protein
MENLARIPARISEEYFNQSVLVDRLHRLNGLLLQLSWNVNQKLLFPTPSRLNRDRHRPAFVSVCSMLHEDVSYISTLLSSSPTFSVILLTGTCQAVSQLPT